MRTKDESKRKVTCRRQTRNKTMAAFILSAVLFCFWTSDLQCQLRRSPSAHPLYTGHRVDAWSQELEGLAFVLNLMNMGSINIYQPL